MQCRKPVYQLKSIWYLFVALFLATTSPVAAGNGVTQFGEKDNQAKISALHSSNAWAAIRQEAGSPLRLPANKDSSQAKLIYAACKEKVQTTPTSCLCGVLQEQGEIIEGISQTSFACRSPPERIAMFR